MRTGRDGTVLDKREIVGGALDRDLAGAMAAVLTADVAAVVVLTGPGSYSGVRAGMAAALGVAGARSVPLYGIGNLAAVACAAPVDPGVRFRVVADAGRGGVYTASFERGDAGTTQTSSPSRVEAHDIGDGEPVFSCEAIAGLGPMLITLSAALCAAVPVALALPPLAAAGLSAIHAVGTGGVRSPTVSTGVATSP